MTTNTLTLTQYLDKFYKGQNTKEVIVNNYCSEAMSEVKDLIQKEGKKCIIANPGLGKSVMVTKVAMERKVLFLAPTISIATQMADEYYKETKGTKMATLLCSQVDGYICNKKQDSNLVIAVYDSLIKAIGLGIEISEYVIFIDEVHQTVLATTYRQSAIDMMESLIGDNYTTLTATPYSLVAEDFKHILHIVSKNDKKRTVVFYNKQRNINTKEYVEYITKQVKGKCIILCNNSKNAEELVEYLPHRKCLVVDAKTNKHIREQIVKTKHFPVDIDTIITTEALSDGVSLYDTDITDMILMKQNINLNHLIQFPARARKSNPLVHYVLAETRGKAEQIKDDINFNMFADTDVSRILLKKDVYNLSLTAKQLKELFKHNRKFNKYIMNGEQYTINNNLLAVDFFTREDKLVNKVVIELFKYYGYDVRFIESIKKEEKAKEDKKENKMRYKDIEKQDKVNMVMSELTHLDMNVNNDINPADYKKNITAVVNKVKTILNVDEINPLEAHLYKDIVEIAVELPDNFNKMAGIKRALDALSNIDIFFSTLVKQIAETGKCKANTTEYVFVRDGKYVSKEEQEKIEKEFLWFYNNSIKGKFDYDVFMKCIFKVERDESSNTKDNNIIGVLGKGELYLQGTTIRLD